MAEKKRPAEFPTDWHYEAHLEGLARELAGAEARLTELKEADADAATLERAEAYVGNINEQIQHYAPKKSSRPKEAKETR